MRKQFEWDGATFAFLAAAGMALLSLAVFLHVTRLNPAWTLVAGSAILTAIALRTQAESRTNQVALLEEHSRNELLNTQIVEHTKSVDALADGLDVAIFICDSRAVVIYANRRACELFRFDSPIGRSILAITLSYDLEQLVLSAESKRESQHKEILFTYPEERVGLAKSWVSSSSGRVFLSVYEITDLRRLERVRQDFVANVSHELRTPMTVIRAYAETLLDEDPPTAETAERYLPRIISEVDRLSSITQDLLILSAAESNPVRKQSCDIADVVRGVVIQLQLKATEKKLLLEYDGPLHLLIEANPSQMTQVALNLTDNALNYTPAGSATVAVREEGDEVVLTFTDTGIGISSEHVGRVFERFYRVDKGRSRSTGGTGLGLSIVKHIVESHGGTVSVETALNLGSTFTVRLPIGHVSH